MFAVHAWLRTSVRFWVRQIVSGLNVRSTKGRIFPKIIEHENRRLKSMSDRC